MVGEMTLFIAFAHRVSDRADSRKSQPFHVSLNATAAGGPPPKKDCTFPSTKPASIMSWTCDAKAYPSTPSIWLSNWPLSKFSMAKAIDRIKFGSRFMSAPLNGHGCVRTPLSIDWGIRLVECVHAHTVLFLSRIGIANAHEFFVIVRKGLLEVSHVG